MTINSMKELLDRVTREREENLSEYLEVMNKYFPDKLCSPYERYKNDGGEFGFYELDDKTEEEWKRDFDEYNDTHNNWYSVNDYKDDFRDPQDGSFYCLFPYKMMWEEKSRIPEADFVRKFYSIMSVYSDCKQFLENPEGSGLKDSESLAFDHEDILITDPCYILVEEGNHKDDWHKCNYGSNFEVLGIHKYITRDTLYGDWSCTVWNKDTKEEIGRFCADAGLVSILSLGEVKAYNPDIEKWCEEHKWCATVIRDFTGTAQIKVGFSDKDDYDFYCYVEGEGSVNFYGSQTGL